MNSLLRIELINAVTGQIELRLKTLLGNRYVDNEEMIADCKQIIYTELEHLEEFLRHADLDI